MQAVPPLRPDLPATSAILFYTGLVYLVFVIYGSLVPLDFHYRPLAEAWQSFTNIPYLQLGVGSRADWVANILLYIPLALLFSAGLARRDDSVWVALIKAITVLLGCMLLATTLEFTQIFFPPRTVSLNDLIAELSGTLTGIVLWRVFGSRLAGVAAQISQGGPKAVRSAVVVYVLAYLALSLFPYDFLISGAELTSKLSSGRHHIFMAPAAYGGILFGGIKLLAEAVAVFPLGILLGTLFNHVIRQPYIKVLLCGLLLGMLIEAAQFFLASGITQGISIITRGVGMVLGLGAFRYLAGLSPGTLSPYLKGVVLLTASPYLILLMAFNGWFDGQWGDLQYGLAKLNDLHFLPFYYHYYTSETTSVLSLLSYVVLYFPIGLAYWAWSSTTVNPERRAAYWVISLGAGFAALVMEAGKLFVPGKHPDPTDVLIAAAAACLAYMTASTITRWFSIAPQPPRPATESHSNTVDQQNFNSSGPMRYLSALSLLAVVGAALIHYPVGALWLGLGLTVYAAVLWRHPAAWLIVIPALLPVLDLAPWTGWFFFDEFDLFMLVTLAVSMARMPSGTWSYQLPGVPALLLTLLATSYAVSALIGLWPLPPLDINSFSNYYSPYNSLRVGKGFLWVIVLLPLAAAQLKQGSAWQGKLVTGMMLGLSGVVLAALWERLVFSGLFNFSDDYRITATFSGMHTGGSHVEAYLASAIPFIAAWIFLRRDTFSYLAGVTLFGLATYALMVTFARAGYLAYAGSLVVLGIAIALHFANKHGLKIRSAVVFVSFFLIACVVAIPVLEGRYMKSRFATVDRDVNIRSDHWIGAIRMMDPDWTTALFGMGLGRFPETYFLKNRKGVTPATYSYQHDRDNIYLRLGSGDSLYFGQRISLAPETNYTLAMDLRSTTKNTALTIPVCQKSMLYSYSCAWLNLAPSSANGGWEHRELVFNSKGIGAGNWYAKRPVELALYNGRPGTQIDVDNVRLLDAERHDIIVNGDFEKGNNRWFFATDNHLPWHIKNLWVQIFFEQGWFGLLTTGLILVLALTRLVARVREGDLFAGSILAALSGFLLVGIADSLFDAPRLTLLFFLLVLLGAGTNTHRAQGMAQ